MTLFMSHREMGYGGRQVLRGEVFERGYHRLDGKLLELKYVEEVPDKGSYPRCDVCSRQFVSQSMYDAHLHAHVQVPDNPPVTKIEDQFPGGMVQDMATGRTRAARV